MIQTRTIVTVNVNGLTNPIKQALFKDFLKKHDVDIVLLQEIKDDSMEWLFGYQYVSNKGLHSRGTAIAYRPHIVISDVVCEPDGRITSLNFEDTFHLINIYAPSGAQARCDREVFFSTQLPLHLSTNLPIIMMGDFNCVLKRDDCLGNFNFSFALDGIVSGLGLFDVWYCLGKNSKDNKFTFKRGKAGSRIDRAYVTQNIREQICSVSNEICAFSDHNALVVKFKVDRIRVEHGWSYFKINNFLINNQGIKHAIIEQINYEKQKYMYNNDICKWWVAAKNNIKNYYKYFWSQQNKDHKAKLSFYYEVLNEINSLPPTQENSQLAAYYKKEIYYIKLEYEYKKLSLKSKRTVVEEDTISVYNILKQKHQQNRHISIMVNEKNENICGTNNIIKYIHSWFRTKFNNQIQVNNHKEIKCLLAQLDKKIKIDKFNNLTKPITVEEILCVLKSSQKKKTPGPDGFPYEFYIVFWDNIKYILCRLFNVILDGEDIPEAITEGIITLIPKTRNPKAIKQYRAITLINADIKLFNKIIANRLKSEVDELLGKGQTCGRNNVNIINGLNTIRDIILYFQRNASNKCALLSIDFETAFDNVGHRYLMQVLTKFNFPDKIVNVVEKIYRSATSKVLVNGFLTKSFKMTQGIRQGCPLSMILFSLSVEPLIRMFHMSLAGVNIMAEKIVSLAYADDITVALSHENDVRSIQTILDIFQSASNARVNVAKTKIYPVANWPEISTPFKVSGDDFKLLGMYVNRDFSKMIEKNWQEIYNRINGAIISQKSKNLNFLNKIMFINTYLFSKIWYIAQVLPIKNDFLAKIIKITNTFLWSGSLFKIARKQLYLPKIKGGVNLIDVDAKRFALFLKNAFLILKSPGNSASREIVNDILTSFLSDIVTFQVPQEYIPYINKIIQLNLDPENDNTTKGIYKKIVDAQECTPYVCTKNKNIKWDIIWNVLATNCLPTIWIQTLYFIVNDVYPYGEKKFRNNIESSALCKFCNVTETLTHRMCYCQNAFDIWNWTRNMLIYRIKLPPDKCYPITFLQSKLTTSTEKFHAGLWYMAACLYFNLEVGGNIHDFLTYLRQERLRQKQFCVLDVFKKYIFMF